MTVWQLVTHQYVIIHIDDVAGGCFSDFLICTKNKTLNVLKCVVLGGKPIQRNSTLAKIFCTTFIKIFLSFPPLRYNCHCQYFEHRLDIDKNSFAQILYYLFETSIIDS